MGVINWPKEPSLDNPYFQDGNYSRNLGQVSPEGNIYGQERFVCNWKHFYWWNGLSWSKVEVVGRSLSYNELPKTKRPFGEIWQVRVYDSKENRYWWQEHYWDSEDETWKEIQWMWDVEILSDLPSPGMVIGEAHIVTEPDVPVFWDGYEWKRRRHSSLDDDEPERHLPPGFLSSMNPDARVVWLSKTEIGIEGVNGAEGNVPVNGEIVTVTNLCGLINSYPIISWDEETQTITGGYIKPNTTYFIYLANNESPEFNISAIPETNEHPAASAWDFRGRLLLSENEAINGYLGLSGAATNARLVGVVHTDGTPYSENGPFFLRELDISIISRTVSFPETYREYSDFRLVFKDENTLHLKRKDNTYGQIYVAGSLNYLGVGHTLQVSGARLVVSNDGEVSIDSTAIQTQSLYYVYVAGNIDAFNFNVINPKTNRPYEAKDGSAYHPDMDFRLRIFLCGSAPVEGLLTQTYPGYCARYIGQVYTDQNGKFKPSESISSINIYQYVPETFSSLSDVVLKKRDSHVLELVPKRNGSGRIMVAEQPLFYSDIASCDIRDYIVANYSSDIVTALTTPSTGHFYYIYLAADFSYWKNLGLSLKMFLSETPPVDGYLSLNWPGNTARHIGYISFIGSIAVEDTTLANIFEEYPKSWKTTSLSGLSVLSPLGWTLDISANIVITGPNSGFNITGNLLVNNQATSPIYGGVGTHTHNTTGTVQVNGVGTHNHWVEIHGRTSSEVFYVPKEIVPVGGLTDQSHSVDLGAGTTWNGEHNHSATCSITTNDFSGNNTHKVNVRCDDIFTSDTDSLIPIGLNLALDNATLVYNQIIVKRIPIE